MLATDTHKIEQFEMAGNVTIGRKIIATDNGLDEEHAFQLQQVDIQHSSSKDYCKKYLFRRYQVYIKTGGPKYTSNIMVTNK